ncbi:hypothetical protein EX30DRAFT_395136 [Ascodesmis nigricans]|uniref:Uncharacterized protein n=1 Tax=Ascodesmis nigricans TaxID=341454 RepID=A0A4S2MZW5_9PEZI|nr:hypothetical protein EX30DRAFT_395136 [Ascodesmis nigricans]
MSFLNKITIVFGGGGPSPQQQYHHQHNINNHNTGRPAKPNLTVYTGPGPYPVAMEMEKPPRRRYRWRHLFIHLASLAVSAAIIGCIAIFCRIFEGETLPDWRLNTLNAVVAWLAAAAKLGIVIPLADVMGQVKWSQFMTVKRKKLSDLEYADAAGRHALGALEWLLRLRGGTLIHLGAALVIVSLGFDPAFQYLLQYDLISAPDPFPPEPAQIRQNTAYTPERGLDRGLIFAAPESMLLGLHSTIFGSGGISANFQCTSGNCTFPSYPTVGICSSCQDISAKLNRTCVDITPSNKVCTSSTNCFTSGQICSYTDTQRNATAGGGLTYFDLQARGRDFQATSASATTITLDSDLIEMTAVYIHPSGSESDPRLPEIPGYVPSGGDHVAHGFTCQLSYCERIMTSTVSLGKFYESSTPSHSTASQFTLPALRFVDDLTDELFSQKMQLTDSSHVSVAAMFALSAGFSRAITGRSDVPKSIFPEPGEVSELHRAMYQRLLSTPFPKLMERIATSVTAAIRNDGTPVYGETYTHHIAISVEWRWFAYPAVLWALVLVLLVAVSLLARRREEAWLGTSQLAGMCIGVEEEVREDLAMNWRASLRDKKEMRGIGEKIKARIVRDREGAMEFTRLPGNLR